MAPALLSGPSPRPLIVTGDAELLDDLLQLTVAAGVEPEVAPDLTGARSRWLEASLVIVADDVAAAGVGVLPPRPGVVLVGTDLDDATVWDRATDLGAEAVVFLPDGGRWLADRLATATDTDAEAAETVCVVGGRGGGGATTVAAALAVTGMRYGLRSLLVDADPLGGGIDLALGAEDTEGARWAELAGSHGRVSGDALRDALPAMAELSVLTWTRGGPRAIPPEAVQAVLEGGKRSHDLVVVDLPRHLDAAGEVALMEATVALLVVPAEVRAVAAATQVLSGIRDNVADVRVVVRGPSPSGLTGDVVAETLGVALAGTFRSEPGLMAALERGEPPGRSGRGPLARFCAGFLAELLPDLGAAA